jgi:hypothetical protein
MNTNQQMEERLWNYIDGVSSEDEKSLIEKLLASDAAFRAKYQELLGLHQLLGKVELEEPSMRFTLNVMEEVAKYGVAKATGKYINKRIIWGIAAFFFIMIGAMLVYGFSLVNWHATPGTSIIPIDIKKWEPSKIVTNTYVNIFMMVNIVLFLYLLDRYLSRKRAERMTGHSV